MCLCMYINCYGVFIYEITRHRARRRIDEFRKNEIFLLLLLHEPYLNDRPTTLVYILREKNGANQLIEYHTVCVCNFV